MPRGRPRKTTNTTEMMVNGLDRNPESFIPHDTLKEVVPEPTAKVTTAQKSLARKLTPNRAIPVKRVAPITEAMQKERTYGWEYVEGIFENRFSIGESLSFWKNPFPGDPYAEWTIPCNVTVAVPRWVAKHLNERKYVQFKYRDQSNSRILQSDDFVETFEPDAIQHRTTFINTNAY